MTDNRFIIIEVLSLREEWSNFLIISVIIIFHHLFCITFYEWSFNFSSLKSPSTVFVVGCLKNLKVHKIILLWSRAIKSLGFCFYFDFSMSFDRTIKFVQHQNVQTVWDFIKFKLWARESHEKLIAFLNVCRPDFSHIQVINVDKWNSYRARVNTSWK